MMGAPASDPSASPAVVNQHVLVILLDRRNSGLERVMSLFRRRGPAFSSMHIEPSAAPDIVRMTIYFSATNATMEQALLHLRKIVDIQALHTLNI
ncbi:MAG: hypothetical protein H0X24_22930 [Ktedonobacterales bacterium]|nr:hypothetical protein [Ktedonobacterales bacterium]